MVPEDFETKLQALGLTFERLPLKARPNAIHWHIRKSGETGTLEATLENGNLEIQARRNRMGGWIESARKALE